METSRTWPSSTTLWNVLITDRSRPVSSIARCLQLLWALWLAGVISGSLLPLDSKELTHTTGALHRTVHIVAFGVIAVGSSAWTLGLVHKIVAGVGVFGLAAVIELLQYFFYGNAYEWADVREDGVGVLLGFFLSALLSLLHPSAR